MSGFPQYARLIGSRPDSYDGPWPPVVNRPRPSPHAGACGHMGASICPACLAHLIERVDPFQSAPTSREEPESFDLDRRGFREHQEDESEGSLVLL